MDFPKEHWPQIASTNPLEQLNREVKILYRKVGTHRRVRFEDVLRSNEAIDTERHELLDARAGEAGKGFAVVASEVKNLASQTARATEEIGGQIAAVQGETGRVVEAIRAIGGTIEKISGIAASIAAAVEEQGAATAEIARNVQQAAAGTGAVSANIGSVQEAASGSGAAAAQVRGAAAELSRSAETLRSQVERFLAEMRAA